MEQNCIFCDVARHKDRIITEDEHFYVIPTLGQITDGGYVLIIPKGHYQCIFDMPIEKIRILQLYRVLVEHSLMREYSKEITSFEHGIVGQTIKHAHLHVLPANVNFTDRIKQDFPDNFLMTTVSLRAVLQQYNFNRKPYLYWWQSNDFCCWDPPAPPQYLRTVAAELLGRPERADWKKMDPELDKKLIEETVQRLRPHFRS